MRTFEELRGTCANLITAAKRSSSLVSRSMMIAFNFLRLPPSDFAMRRRLVSRSTVLVFAMGSLLACSGLFLERHLETFEQRTRFLVGCCRRADGDVHAANLVDLVVIDFREHDLFL